MDADKPDRTPKHFADFSPLRQPSVWTWVRGHGGHPLCVLDDHSRYNVLLAACADQTEATVQTHLTSAFRLHGLPDSVLWDIAWDSDGSLRPNHGECVREFWHAPRLQIAGEKWTIGFGVHSNVVLKYRY